MTARVRPIAEPDWPRIITLEAETYRAAGLSEDPAVLRSRAGRSGTSFVLDIDGEVAGYLLALPYPATRVPVLGVVDPAVFTSPNLHLHDMVVAVRHRRAGWGGRLVRHLLAAAYEKEFDRVSLVSVRGRQSFWSARGFRAQAHVTSLSGYGPDATYMSRPVAPEGSSHALRP
jgi:ornithine decarboxylase